MTIDARSAANVLSHGPQDQSQTETTNQLGAITNCVATNQELVTTADEVIPTKLELTPNQLYDN